MPIIALPAYFDGERICLDETFELEQDAKLIVTVLPKQNSDIEHEEMISFLPARTISNKAIYCQSP